MHSIDSIGKDSLRQLAAARAKIALLETALKNCRQQLDVANRPQVQQPAPAEKAAPPGPKKDALHIPKTPIVTSLDADSFKTKVC